ncbi:DUF6193 family natural product biosynthesis protein [Streptomyces sp. NPDC048389]|uniref:DUF6193 family natural product biosynthesis protein n=1 Tax=Streptomyces sp. NPDC048389 TaxID=3154622 RepID=UPI0034569798
MTDLIFFGLAEDGVMSSRAMRPDPFLYPDVEAAGGDLVAALRETGKQMGVPMAGLGESYPPEGRSSHFAAVVEAECGDVRIELRQERREVTVMIRMPLLGIGGYGATGSLEVAVEVAHAWRSGMPLAEMAAEWEFLTVTPEALAHDQGKAVEFEWASIQRLPANLIDQDLVAAAFRSPELRSLFPIVTHGSLQFRRRTISGPGSDVPSIFPMTGGRWRVICLWDPKIPKRIAETTEEAVGIVVAGLPEGCGAAVEVIRAARRGA